MGKVLRKLQSNNGATLMLALLFFIVCAVTGSMILTSAGVSAGRLENMKRRDQNYFAVRSAIEMLKQQMLEYNLPDKPIEFTETLTINETTYKDDDKEDERDVVYVNSGNVEADVQGDFIRPLLRDANVSFYSAKDGASSEKYEEEFFKPWYKGAESDKPAQFKFENANLTGNGDNNLNVDVDMTLNSLGELVFKVNNSKTIDGKNNKDIYYMTLTMDVDVTCEKKINCEEDEHDDSNKDDDVDDGYKTTVTEYINNYKYTFKVRSIKKG